MKTKFKNTPPGYEGKRARDSLRKYARSCLDVLFTWLEHSDYPQLKFNLGYTLPGTSVRGSFNVTINRNEVLHFFISPGDKAGRFIADKVLYVYTREGQSVYLEVRDERLNNLFDYYERTGAVRIELEKAQRAN